MQVYKNYCKTYNVQKWLQVNSCFAGLEAYESEHYLEAVDLIESALPMYKQALNDCLLMCEDMLVMNITEENMTMGMREILEHYSNALIPDTLDYYSVLAKAIKEVLECRVQCHDDVARVKGEVLGDYLPLHFHYLQFAYYKCKFNTVMYCNIIIWLCLPTLTCSGTVTKGS